MSKELSFRKLSGVFKNPFLAKNVGVTDVHGPADFLALVYQCKFNVDWDGAPTAYGWNRPGSALQQNLRPIEGPPHGHLANATSPYQNFGHNQDFSWVGVYSAKPAYAAAHNLVIDDRPQLESRRPASWQQAVLPNERGYLT